MPMLSSPSFFVLGTRPVATMQASTFCERAARDYRLEQIDAHPDRGWMTWMGRPRAAGGISIYRVDTRIYTSSEVDAGAGPPACQLPSKRNITVVSRET